MSPCVITFPKSQHMTEAYNAQYDFQSLFTVALNSEKNF